MGQHSSYATPPNKRFYKTIKKANSATDSDAITSATANSASTLSVSPGKRVNLRGQCVQQLLQLHQLLERGGISKQQYDDMQSTIMGDVRSLTDLLIDCLVVHHSHLICTLGEYDQISNHNVESNCYTFLK